MGDTPIKVQRKSTPQKVHSKDCTLSVLSLLRAGVRPSQIWEKHGISKRSVQYVLRKLRASGAIRKLGYGTWEVVHDAPGGVEKVQIVHRVTPRHTPPEGAPSNTVRGNGVQAVVKVPRGLQNWKERDIIMSRSGIPFKLIPQGQRIEVGEVKKVWLTDSSIVYYLPFSWYGPTSPEVAGQILEDTVALITRTERYLGIASLKIDGNYKIKFSRRHMSLIRNGLARLYNQAPRRKLFIRDDGGVWLLVDNSYNENELEHVKARPSQVDEVTAVQNFFNGLKTHPITPEFILDSLGQASNMIKSTAANLSFYAKNMESHVLAVNSLSYQASENIKTTVSLREAVARLAETVATSGRPSSAQARERTEAPPAPEQTPEEKETSRAWFARGRCILCGKRRYKASLYCQDHLEERRGGKVMQHNLKEIEEQHEESG